MTHETTYSAQIIRSGQPRPYADTENEYLITVRSTQYGKDGLHPWLLHGDLETRIAEEEQLRKAGKMLGGYSPEQLRTERREWAKKLVRALCQNFREKDDQDGRQGMEAHFYPTLEWLKLDDKAGTIRALIIEPYTD